MFVVVVVVVAVAVVVVVVLVAVAVAVAVAGVVVVVAVAVVVVGCFCLDAIYSPRHMFDGKRVYKIVAQLWYSDPFYPVLWKFQSDVRKI